jgi:hypothetical protein
MATETKTIGPARVRVDFEPDLAGEAEAVAGAPLELIAEVALVDGPPRQLAVLGDRSRGRIADFSFLAVFEGGNQPLRLSDPGEGTPFTGGPAAAFTLASDTPLRQRVLVNLYADLERVRAALDDGQTGTLRLTCLRRLALAEVAAEALAADPVVVSTELTIAVRRDDTTLVALWEGLYQTVLERGPDQEDALTKLIASRAEEAAVHLRALSDFPDPGVAVRARAALATPGRPD